MNVGSHPGQSSHEKTIPSNYIGSPRKLRQCSKRFDRSRHGTATPRGGVHPRSEIRFAGGSRDFIQLIAKVGNVDGERNEGSFPSYPFDQVMEDRACK
eukprot:scaffold74_cov277-Chaetoceros_neogracile.AAC.3